MSQMFPDKPLWPLWIGMVYKKQVVINVKKILKFHIKNLDLGTKPDGN